jgi:hypothetical protein
VKCPIGRDPLSDFAHVEGPFHTLLFNTASIVELVEITE